MSDNVPLSGCPLNKQTQHGIITSSGHNSVEKLVYISPMNGKKFSIPSAAKKCTWNKDAKKNGVSFPHTTQRRNLPGKIVPDVLKLIGNTPMVKLNSIPEKAGVKCNIYAKLEYLNPGGSIKDRVAKRMIEDAEEQGLLKPGMTIIEPSSGNTGIGIALASAIKGYKCIIVMHKKNSDEKQAVLNALGATLILTAITADSFSPEGVFGVANRLHQEIPNSLILDQFSNPGNPLAHYDTTSEEILEQCDYKVDVLMLGAGTGGTVTGMSRKFKEVSPQTKIICVDPEGSVYALPESLNKTDVKYFEVEGLGDELVPTSLDRTGVDFWLKSNDEESFIMARRLIREEGILCGSSSGAVVSAALKVAKDLKEGQNLVVMITDSIRNYMTKFVSDQWMEARGYHPCANINSHWWWEEEIRKVKYQKIKMVFVNETCDSVLSLMKNQNQNQIAVLKLEGDILGIVTIKHLINNILSKQILPNDIIGNCTIKIYPKVDVNKGHLGLVSRMLEKDSYVVITEDKGTGYSKTERPLGVIDITDLYEYISQEKDS